MTPFSRFRQEGTMTEGKEELHIVLNAGQSPSETMETRQQTFTVDSRNASRGRITELILWFYPHGVSIEPAISPLVVTIRATGLIYDTAGKEVWFGDLWNDLSSTALGQALTATRGNTP